MQTNQQHTQKLTTRTVSNCISAATVNGDQYVGGIAGRLLSSRNENAKERCVIDNCYFTGTAAVAGGASSKNAVGARGPIEDFEGQSSGYTNGQILVTLLADDGNEDVKNATRMENYNNQTCDVKISGLTLKKDDKWHAICLPFGLDDTTGITTLSTEPGKEATSTTGWHTLDGHRVSGKPDKGIYILNGKKVVVK